MVNNIVGEPNQQLSEGIIYSSWCPVRKEIALLHVVENEND